MPAHSYNSEIASKYDTLRRWRPPIPQRIFEISRIRKEDRVLDLGCGTGNLALALRDIQNAAYAGIDLSAEMLAVAAQKIPDFLLVRGDVAQMPFSNEVFDCATGAFFLHHLPPEKHSRFFKETFRVLRKGSLLMITRSHEQIAQCLIGRMFPEVIELDRARFPDIGRILEGLSAAGFRNPAAESLPGKRTRLDSEIISWMEKKPISTLDMISPEAFERGMERLRALVAASPSAIEEDAPFTLVFGEKI